MADFDELLPEEEERTGNGEQTRSTDAEGGSWRRRLSTVAAILFVIVLVGSLLLVVSRIRRSDPDAPRTTLHPSKLVGGPGNLISLHMIDPTTGWALSEHAVLRTTDGGLHWKNVTPPSTLLTRESIADFLTASLAWVTTPQANGATTQVLRTMDSGQTWQQSTVPAVYLKQMAFVDAQHGWILAGWGSGGGAAEAVVVFRTGDGGKTWRNVASALPASTDTPPPGHLPFGGQKSGIHFLNVSTGWITGTVVVNDLAWLYSSHDGGSTWYRQLLSMPSGIPSAQLSLVSPTFFSATDGILPIIFSDGITGRGIATDIYVTHDEGTTWKSTTPLPLAAVAIDFVDRQHGWATDGKMLYRTSDGGQHWIKLSQNANFKQVTSLDFVSSTLGWAISGQGKNSSLLLKTTDGGQTWTPIPIMIS
jgi:photosystem II stability/assembly factor-like uncharacterized protein